MYSLIPKRGSSKTFQFGYSSAPKINHVCATVWLEFVTDYVRNVKPHLGMWALITSLLNKDRI